MKLDSFALGYPAIELAWQSAKLSKSRVISRSLFVLRYAFGGLADHLDSLRSHGALKRAWALMPHD